ncbi:hypothetical protein CCO03_08285 [Comamonas serinivorans]|uniref:Zinc-ribbon domain-containing protein n=1 Tax=Comamonas serinivorans TaxID=1082851 RepID=A0A1Y0EMI7_9BURK|nr:zinc ribbon domain-containing protein [Comamonas serinivorans]ARU04671.1 hypothetical protein CCO03_08285 [Comamonas serinivorans]
MSSIVCPHCAAENRGNAKFCSSCAKLMVDLNTGELLPARKRRRRRRIDVHTPRTGLLRPASAALVVGVLALGCAWWYFTEDAARQTSAQQATGSFQPHTPTASAALPDAVSVREAAATPPAPALAEFPSYVPVATAPPSLASAPVAAAAASHPSPVKPAPAPKPKAKPKEVKPQRPEPPPAPRVAEAPPPVAAADPTPAPPPRPSPEQACQGQAFLARAACMQSQCSANSSHPQCRRMREQQDALRRGSGGG